MLGLKTTIHAAEEAVSSTDILEYTLRIPPPAGSSDPYYLRLIDVPGLDGSENLEHDAEILSSLKSYLHDKGLPTFFMVVSRFDDIEFTQPNSQFALLLKRVKYFQRALYHTGTDNTVFLFTRLLSVPPEQQQSPEGKINEFRRFIEQHVLVPQPIEIVVGDNKPDNDTVQFENGFYKFPNNELYPKNIWDKLLEVAERSIVPHDSSDHSRDITKHIINSMIKRREVEGVHTQELVAHAVDEDIFESDLEAFEYLLRQDNLAVPHNEVQNYLQATYEKLDPTAQIHSCLQLLTLQLALRNLNIKTIQQIPQSLHEEVKFFQDVDGVLTSKFSLFYLKQAFDVEVPEYPMNDLVVGHGFDLITDRLLRKTPFLRNPIKRPSSSLGYQFPDFVECERLTNVEEAILANISDSMKEYREERLNLLSFTDKEDVVIGKLKGEVKPFLNFDVSTHGKLSAVKEIRLLECKMTVENDSVGIINEHFISAVNTIPPLNTSDADSITAWHFLLHNYGTHVVTKAYGGGSYRGTVLLSEPTLYPRDKLHQVLNAIVNFDELGVEIYGAPIFHYIGDEDTINLDPRACHISTLHPPAERNAILDAWKTNLNMEFKMLKNELELVPLSQIVAVVNSAKGRDAEVATRLLLRGNLKVASGGGSNRGRGQSLGADKRAKARNQARALKTANLERTLEKFRKFDLFVEEHSS